MARVIPPAPKHGYFPHLLHVPSVLSRPLVRDQDNIRPLIVDVVVKGHDSLGAEFRGPRCEGTLDRSAGVIGVDEQESHRSIDLLGGRPRVPPDDARRDSKGSQIFTQRAPGAQPHSAPPGPSGSILGMREYLTQRSPQRANVGGERGDSYDLAAS